MTRAQFLEYLWEAMDNLSRVYWRAGMQDQSNRYFAAALYIYHIQVAEGYERGIG
jgi:hypothetical protein